MVGKREKPSGVTEAALSQSRLPHTRHRGQDTQRLAEVLAGLGSNAMPSAETDSWLLLQWGRDTDRPVVLCFRTPVLHSRG